MFLLLVILKLPEKPLKEFGKSSALEFCVIFLLLELTSAGTEGMLLSLQLLLNL